MGTAELIEVLLAIILPPVGVFLRFGCRIEFWICLFFTVLGYLPGVIYALYVLLYTSSPPPPPVYYHAPAPPSTAPLI
ncbi:hypothetical protein GOP47_0006973 [Adiantum capillus-veneris]|uniref:Uncharacterized protein n=1 Tax=Adiantum capillus-veneris TaxID=13818 RepID=A0A9D4V030_ADICA|nr:hypothetical protein GOP47_0006973 [Adiantum capillus-veneris]